MARQSVEERLSLLEDIEGIRKLKARYALYCDSGYAADKLAELFVENGVWDGGKRFGKYAGREAIRKFFQGVPQMISFAVHDVINPIIEVKGNKATGIWNLFMMGTFVEGNRAIWGSARYDEEYVKVKGKWKFKRIKLTSNFWTPFEEGWVKKRMI